mgnify:CR=1 FL=1
MIGNATRAEFGDRQVHAGDPQVYDITVSANDMGNGVTAIEYIGIAASRSIAATEALVGKVIDPVNATRPPKPAKGPRPPNNGSSRVMRSTTSP